MAEAAGPALQALAERYWQFLRHEFPLGALLAGQPNDDPTMFREGPQDFARRAAQAELMLAALAGISRDGLSLQDGITHRLLERELDDLREAYATGSHLRPWLLPAGPEFNTIFLANVSQFDNVQGARLYVARLGSLPAYFADVRACMTLGADSGVCHPGVVLSAAVANLRAAAAGAADQSPWFGPFRRSPAAAQAGVVSEAQFARELIERDIQPALLALADFIEGELLPRARDTIACTEGPMGHEFYGFWVRHFTTCRDLTPRAVHQLGLEQVERLEREMAAVAAQAGFEGDAQGYRSFLREEPSFHAPTADEVLIRIQALAKRIDGKIPGVIGHLPRATYTVQSIPAAVAGKLPLAYAQPSPADGSAAGTFWVSSLPGRVPDYLHVSLTLHEAWPGHLMHIALMQEMDSLPMFRRANFTRYSACLEGWAMYCEGLGHEMGLYETPHQHFGRLDMEMWRACRLVVDTGIHLEGWTRAQAVDYMARRLTLALPAIEAEVDRYIAMPAQALGYMLGGLKFRELRQRAQQRLGERFSLRAYHDQLMAAGAVTLPVLEEVIDRWLDDHAA
jgi:uncharacterized protein (DUF885 family)